MDRTFDCSGMIDDDGGDGNSELYAEADVDQAACGFPCSNDSPRTGIADLSWLSDDPAEPDDSASEAVEILPGFASDRISNDGADRISFELAEASPVGLTVIHDPAAGRLDALLRDETETQIAVFQREPDATLANETPAAGIYFVVISPDEAGNPNFYDFALEVTAAPSLPVLSLWALPALLIGLMGVAARRFLAH